MKKSAVFVLIFTFMVLAGFYSSSKRPDPAKVSNPAVLEVIPTATISVKPSVKPATKPTVTNKTPTSTATPTPTSAPASGKTTLDQVAKHNSKNDCYLVIKSNVYDVSSYISSHPGGPGKIISKCGQEVTGIFASIHSNFAWDLLAKYKIGQI